jgi:3-oxoacyl-[acyl-carrier-protein] synthase-3
MNNKPQQRTRAAVTAVGHYVPDKVLTNADLEKMVETTDEWIMTRTGIKERRILENGATSDMGAGAVRSVLAQRGIGPEEIDVIIVATVTPDMLFPPTATLIQEKVGAKNAWGFDLSAACSGFVYALVVGSQFIEAGTFKKVIVVGSDKMSSISDYTDRNTCVLFGDAAGAVLLEPSDDPMLGIQDFRLYCDGSGEKYLHMKAGGSLNPPTHETVDKKWHYIYQDGKNVFKAAVKGMADLRIIDACRERMGLDPSKVMINIERYGNTTAATIPLCLSEWHQAGKLKRGSTLVLASFGAGYTWGAILLKWSLNKPA